MIPSPRPGLGVDRMKLIGIVTGTYEGNNYAKLIFTEPLAPGKGLGENAVISKASYDYVMLEVMPQAALYLGHDVRAFYDRFGKCNGLAIDEPLKA